MIDPIIGNTLAHYMMKNWSFVGAAKCLVTGEANGLNCHSMGTYLCIQAGVPGFALWIFNTRCKFQTCCEVLAP